jgi:hypothetical protein
MYYCYLTTQKIHFRSLNINFAKYKIVIENVGRYKTQ